MAQVESVDYNLKRVYLHQDTVNNGFDVILAHFEINALRCKNNNGEQNRLTVGTAEGNIQKTVSTFTPRFEYIDYGWRYVPYNGVTHILRLLAEMVSRDGVTDSDAFDLSGFAVNVHIVPDYDAIEIREVSTGSALTTEEHNQLMAAATASDIYASPFIK